MPFPPLPGTTPNLGRDKSGRPMGLLGSGSLGTLPPVGGPQFFGQGAGVIQGSERDVSTNAIDSVPTAWNAPPVQPTDPAAMYASLFGTTTPEQRVSQGLPAVGPIMPPGAVPPNSRQPTPGGVPPNGGGADKTPAPPKATPQQAGANNSMMPGWSNGNPAVGYPGSEHGFAPQTGGAGNAPLPNRPPTDPLNAAATMPPPPPPRGTLPPVTPPGMETMPTVGGAPDAPATPTGTFPPVTAPLSTDIPVVPRDPDAAPQLAAAGDAGAQGREADAPPPDGRPTGESKVGTKTASAGVNFDGVNWTLNDGAKLPANWAERTKPQKQKWLTEHASATYAGQQTAEGALDDLKQYTHLKLPSSNPVTSGSLKVTPTTNLQALLDAGIPGDSPLIQLIQRGSDLYAVANGGQEVGGHAKWDQKQAAEYDAIRNALGAYGITFGADAPPATGGGNTGDGSGGGNGGTIPGPTGPSGTPTFPNTPLDLAGSNDPTFTYYLNAFKAYGDKAVAMAEAAVAADRSRAQDNNRQNAVNLVGEGLAGFETNPLFTGSQGLAKSILDNPDPTDWGTIRNNAISDRQKSDEAQIQALGSSAARRFGTSGAGAVAGMTGDIYRASGNETARMLGDLKVQESQGKRTAEMNAINNALRTLGGTSGIQMSNLFNLGGLITGSPTDYANPFAGVAASFQNIDAAKAAADAAEQAGKFTWEDAAGMVASIVGGAAGAGAFGGGTAAAGG